MKKTAILFVILSIHLLAIANPTPIKICSTGCVTGTSNGGTTVFSSGYAWEQPSGTTCGTRYLASHSNIQVTYVDGVNGVVTDSGTCGIEDMACQSS